MKIELAIRDFALPVPRTGSIDALSGYGRAQLQGQEIHAAVQARRALHFSTYEPEVPITHEFEREGYCFQISGRMDGLFRTDPPKIEEIKSTFNIRELSRRLKDAPDDHPYCLQLKTYGYFYYLQNGVIPELSFHLVSTRNNQSDELELEFCPDSYERWLERRLSELVQEAIKSERRAASRRKIAESFPFPFESPRPGQVELIESIESAMSEKLRMLVQAPTGLGKTAGVLYPALKESLARGQRVVYVTPKNSQHAVAEDAVARFNDTGSAVKSLTITAKSKICFKAEPLCNPEYCEFARDYYTKVYEHGAIDRLAKKKKLTSRAFKKLGEELEICPFELQLDVAREADVVICDYNYVFAPRSAFGQLTTSEIGQEGKPNLVIDEAHNLPSRSMDYYSPSLSSFALEKMREPMRELPARFKREAEELLDSCIGAIVACRPDTEKPTEIDPPLEIFLAQDAELRTFLSRYLESDTEIRPKDPVLRLCFYWAEFTAALEFVQEKEREEFFTTFHPHPSGGVIKITCCDASEMLKDSYDEYEQVVAFSATLKPFEYYAKLSGLDPEHLRISEFHSPFPKSNRKLLIIPQISTKYSDRERNFPRIAEAIQKIAALRKGNYLAFFPSFEFLDRVLEKITPPEDFLLLRQERQMTAADHEAILEHLREGHTPTILFAVQGGVFSEGVDYPGEMVIGAFVVGPPLPTFDLERERMRGYYEEHYRSGFDYAYTYPAMAKAVQAAGRVIRSERDRGLIVLMDSRFTQGAYTQSMPSDWFESSPRELISNSILKEVSRFWEDCDAAAPSSPAQVSDPLSESEDQGPVQLSLT